VLPPGPIYYVPGDFVVRPGVTLTIEPGVSLLFSAADTLVGGADPSRVELVIQGQLEAVATLPDSIRFESTTGTPGAWYGVRSQSSGVLHMQDVAIRGAQTAVRCESPGPHTLRNLGISAVVSGVLTGTSICQIQDCRIVGQGGSYYYMSGTGLDVGPNTSTAFPDSTDARPTIVAGFASGVQCGYSGVLLQNLIARDNYMGFNVSNVTINYCTAVRNNIGFNMYQGLLLNSISALNSNYSVSAGSATYGDYLDLWNTSGSNGIVLGPNVASFSPFFLDPEANNFRLGTGSVFKNFGNSGGEIGAYGPGAGAPVTSRKMSWGHVKALYK